MHALTADHLLGVERSHNPTKVGRSIRSTHGCTYRLTAPAFDAGPGQETALAGTSG